MLAVVMVVTESLVKFGPTSQICTFVFRGLKIENNGLTSQAICGNLCVCSLFPHELKKKHVRNRIQETSQCRCKNSTITKPSWW